MTGNGSRPTILVGVTDPGAANALAPVVGLLQREGRVSVVPICGPLAQATFTTFGISSRGEDGAGAEQLLRTVAPMLVLIGTSEEATSLDRRLVKAARDQGIPTLCVLDYWSRYAERFSGAEPVERLAYVPDVICVMDEAARDELVRAGVPPGHILVTGQPYLERYRARVPRLSEAAASRFRVGLGFDPGQRLITFVSETFGWTYDESYRFASLSGSRERTVIVLEHVLAALAELAPTLADPIFVVNKLHPKNRLEEFAWVEQLRLPFPVRSVAAVPNDALLQASTLVIGMTSMLLVEAACLGVPTLAVVPRAVEERIGPHAGPAWPVARDPEDLRTKLPQLLAGGTALDGTALPGAIEQAHRGATRRIVQQLYRIVGVA